ncbi:membrane protein [Pseudomonas syringae CC1557]|uniref:Membrane protein n=1 Tax=Pseudomonas syringae CC1557 TaxID=1357279 RepID=W0MS71_PSESX|nr:RDD family protein [Pseudomonas syringae]AHG39641.1 membrane protein [Pseudomonas syringae CC1557]
MSPSPALPRNAVNRPLDTRIEIETPEGIDMILRPAGLVSRALAFAVDLAIRAGVIGILFVLLQLFDKLGMGLAAIAIFLVNWWYMVLFEVLNQGRTPGKRMLGLRVVHDDGTPIDWSSSVIRNLLRFVDMLPLGYSLGAITCLNHPLFKRLGDLAAGTLVIYSDRPALRPVVPHAEPVIVPFALRLDEQRALLSLAERQGELSAARTQELAAILAEPLHIPADKAVGHVNGIARSLLGPT